MNLGTFHMDWPGIVGKVDAAFELNGNGLYHFLPVFSVKHFPWNYMHVLVFFSTGHVFKRCLLHIMNTNAWFGKRYVHKKHRKEFCH